MDTRAKELIAIGDRLFAKKQRLDSMNQMIAKAFCPWRARFTSDVELGEEFMSDLMSSYPVILMRELSKAFNTMLRPSDKEWMKVEVKRMEGLDQAGKEWLRFATRVQRAAMYDRAAAFVRATNSADEDFTAFGQAPISIEWNVKADALLFRSWHPADVAWTDNVSGDLDAVHRRWKPDIALLAATYGANKLHAKHREKLEKDPYCHANVRHIVVPSEMYRGAKQFRTPLVSLYVDVDNQHIIEEAGARLNPYVIPRWARFPESQYAFSPAAVCALPDARLLQAMTLTLLDAGERAALPPLIAAHEAIRGDLDVRAGGVTWIDRDYDDRMGAPLEALKIDGKGIPYGMEMLQDIRMQLRSAFYLDKLSVPTRGPEMTAYEVAQRVQEYIRNALPLFEPVETDYNGALCERTFEVLMDQGAFGRPDMIPRSLQGQRTEFKFTSPLRDSADKQKGQVFLEGANILQIAAQADPSLMRLPDAEATLRDVLEGIGWEPKWLNSPEEMQAVREAIAQEAQAQRQLAMAEQASNVAKNLGAKVGDAAMV